VGAVGPYCGARMSAGTIVIVGALGASAGAVMRRGTVIALGKSEALLPGFVDSGVHDLTVQRLLVRTLEKHRIVEPLDRLRSLRRWQGDLAVDGKGEILTAP